MNPARSVDGAASARWRWLELTLDYRCNLRCVGCRACSDSGERMDGPEVARHLAWGRQQGIESLWIGGGEPTLRDDLPRIVHAARRLGYREVLLQTNALRLGYPRYLEALLAAGLTRVSVNLKSHRAEVTDRLSGAEGTHALLVGALEQLRAREVPVVADVLLTRLGAADLGELVPYYAALGVRRFWLWLLSATDVEESDVEEAEVSREVPRISELHEALRAARDAAADCGAELATLHTPPCTLPEDLRPLVWSATELRLLVLNPGQAPIPLERSPMEGGARVEACATCALGERCLGPRADYLALHGAAEFRALKAAAGD